MKFAALGVDVGGTKIAAGIVTFPDGQIHAQNTIPTRADRGGEAVLTDVIRVAEELCAEAARSGAPVQAIGIGLCELVDPTGHILSQNCISWHEDRVRERLQHIGPVYIEADVRAAARAEALFGAGKPYRLFLYVSIGTGISSCLMIDGAPYLGNRGATGTMASSPLSIPCESCGRVNRHTLEEIASGTALVQRFNRRKPGAAVKAEDVLDAAATDTQAAGVVQSAGHAVASIVGLLINVLDPEAVIIGGGLGLSEGLYWQSLISSVRQHIWSEVQREVPIVRASTGAAAGVIGSAASAWKKAVSQ
jgi:glucokinase